MKPYGIPRTPCAGPYSDVDDIRTFGNKTSIGGKDYFRHPRGKRRKARVRRAYKRRARAQGKLEATPFLGRNPIRFKSDLEYEILGCRIWDIISSYPLRPRQR